MSWLFVIALVAAAQTPTPTPPSRPARVPRSATAVPLKDPYSPAIKVVWVACTPVVNEYKRYSCSFYSPDTGVLLRRAPFFLSHFREPETHGETRPGYVPGLPAIPERLELRGFRGPLLVVQPPFILVPVPEHSTPAKPTPPPTPKPTVA
jgi:hypothetical protein